MYICTICPHLCRGVVFTLNLLSAVSLLLLKLMCNLDIVCKNKWQWLDLCITCPVLYAVTVCEK